MHKLRAILCAVPFRAIQFNYPFRFGPTRATGFYASVRHVYYILYICTKQSHIHNTHTREARARARALTNAETVRAWACICVKHFHTSLGFAQTLFVACRMPHTIRKFSHAAAVAVDDDDDEDYNMTYAK